MIKNNNNNNKFGPHLSCDEWLGGEAGLRIAYTNKKTSLT